MLTLALIVRVATSDAAGILMLGLAMGLGIVPPRPKVGQ